MNDIKYFIHFNPQFKNLNISEIKKKFNENLKTNEFIYSVDTFFKKYPSFSINEYKNKTNQVKNMNITDTLLYFHTIDNINNTNNINITNSVNIINYENINENIDKLILSIDNIYDNNNNLNICHIFVHFFEVGGGESYLSNFSKNIYFNQTLFINSNYPHNTLSTYNCNKILYNSYDELNLLLKTNNFDIILDHQLYWFNFNITQTVFNEINKNKIIRITHGVPIHFKNITDLNYYYSIELYNEKKHHISWNNHLKFYVNIGVDTQHINKLNIVKKLDLNNVNVIVIGRINEEKVSKEFLKQSIEFIKTHNNYNFCFYGQIDQSYSNYFLLSINNVKNIKWGGIIEPNNMKNIYLENDILIHPSKFEAGATVILEAMSYGLPVIARNTSGVIYALNDTYFLCNTEKEMFDKLLSININNYYDYSCKNIDKIKQYNDKNILLPKLYNEIRLINHINNYNENIPNIIHYIYGFKKQTEDFPFIYYISILSNKIINKPDIIFFHYQYEPFGYWWDKIKCILHLNYIDTTTLYWGKKKIIKYAHKADKIRMDMLYKYGGVYMDIDTITYKSYHNLLKNNFVIGIQEENYGLDKITLYCNAILLSKPGNIFLKKWIDLYENDFNPNGWSESSIFLPGKILSTLSRDELNAITILNKNVFYWYLYNETNKIFEETEETEINNNLLTLHLWNSFSEVYYKSYNDFESSLNKNSIYSLLLKNLLTNI